MSLDRTIFRDQMGLSEKVRQGDGTDSSGVSTTTAADNASTSITTAGSSLAVAAETGQTELSPVTSPVDEILAAGNEPESATKEISCIDERLWTRWSAQRGLFTDFEREALAVPGMCQTYKYDLQRTRKRKRFEDDSAEKDATGARGEFVSRAHEISGFMIRAEAAGGLYRAGVSVSSFSSRLAPCAQYNTRRDAHSQDY
ncbi:unnamed protein product [Pleuronectes platessa]|uniref:Uncharacterized protein n=1 Tax=Pleuronectes platessa TaxID=8262 RepID=A0A9N7U495_PLEPL|nr:unnamed protein product [Pleuronectes platessa]